MRRRLLLPAAALTALLTLPTSASAAILEVRVDGSAAPALCVSTSAGVSAVSVTVGRPGAGALVTVSSATPQALQCDGSAGRSFLPALPFGSLDGAAGTTLAVGDSAGDTAAVPFPVASFETDHAGFSGRLHLRNLPTAGDTQIANGGSLPATGVTTGTYDSGEIASPGANVTVTATIGGKAFRAVLAPRAFAAEVEGAGALTSVTVHGADPNGGAVALELSGPTGVLARRSAFPRAGGGLDASATFALSGPAGSVVTATQGAWTTRTRLGSAAFTPDGFAVSIPDSPAGCAGQNTCISGSYQWELAFHDPVNATGAAGALGPCHALGPDVSAAGGCGAFAPGTARTSVTAGGELPVVDDAISVALTDSSLGSSTVRLTAPGVRGSLEDGGLHVRGAARQPVTAAISSPRGALPALKFTKTALSDAGGVTDLGPARNAFPLRVADGATVGLSGAGVGSLPVGFRYRLAVALTGTVLSGNTTPGARVLVVQSQGARSDRQVATASAGGLFVIAPHDPAPGDEIVVSAADPATHGVTTRTLLVGGLAPQIQTLVDQQPVRAGATASITGLPAGTSVLWGGDIPATLAGTPFALPVDRVPDGPVRITATAQSGPSATDYLYVIVDSTAPDGGAGADQTVPVGRRVVFVTQAHDALGLASVRFRFKAKGNGVLQPASQLGQPFRHAFGKAGTYAVTVTITDLAGNVTADRAIVRVAKGLASALNGRWPARASRTAGLKLKLSARAPGDLSLQILRANGKLALTRTIPFDRARVGKRIAIGLKRLRAGRYVAVRQFVDANGVAGPVVATPLVIA
ncbi:MAG: hypothetical protein QOE87_3138 [Gaiellales bacterium]|nr:hypothetical protein [Gaiellales bacterium]